MNKRQKKKQVTKAMNRLGSDEFTPKDKQVLMTYGRQQFIDKYNHAPEILEVDMSLLIESATEVFKNIKEGVKSVMYEMGRTFIRMSGKEQVHERLQKNLSPKISSN